MNVTDYVLAGLLGAVFGASELLTRYRDDPRAALSTLAGLTYMAVNVLVAAVTVAIAELFGWTFGLPVSSPAKVRAVQVIGAGLASMAVLRSSLFTLRMGSQDVGVGLNLVAEAFLRAADAAVDRRRGVARDLSVRVMDAVAFEKTVIVLPSYCMGLMQNLSTDDETALARRVAAIRDLATDDSIKCRLLGLAIINVMGERVLVTAIDSIGDRIKVVPTTPESSAVVRA